MSFQYQSLSLHPSRSLRKQCIAYIQREWRVMAYSHNFLILLLAMSPSLTFDCTVLASISGFDVLPITIHHSWLFELNCIVLLIYLWTEISFIVTLVTDSAQNISAHLLSHAILTSAQSVIR